MILLKVSGLCWQTRIRFFNPPPTSVVLISINSRIHVLRRVLIFVSIIMLDKIDQLLVILENLIDWVDWLSLTTCTFRFSKNLEINFGVWSHGKKKNFLQLYIYDGDFELKTSWKTALSKNLFKLCFLPLNFLFCQSPTFESGKKGNGIYMHFSNYPFYFVWTQIMARTFVHARVPGWQLGLAH